MNTYKKQEAFLLIPNKEIIGQAITIRIEDKVYLIAHNSIKIPLEQEGLSRIVIDAVVVVEKGHFPNPMVEFDCLNISKVY